MARATTSFTATIAHMATATTAGPRSEPHSSSEPPIVSSSAVPSERPVRVDEGVADPEPGGDEGEGDGGDVRRARSQAYRRRRPEREQFLALFQIALRGRGHCWTTTTDETHDRPRPPARPRSPEGPDAGFDAGFPLTLPHLHARAEELY